jgi:hypothetical protein
MTAICIAGLFHDGRERCQVDGIARKRANTARLKHAISKTSKRAILVAAYLETEQTALIESRQTQKQSNV